jgi:hypothetical protein
MSDDPESQVATEPSLESVEEQVRQTAIEMEKHKRQQEAAQKEAEERARRAMTAGSEQPQVLVTVPPGFHEHHEFQVQELQKQVANLQRDQKKLLEKAKEFKRTGVAETERANKAEVKIANMKKGADEFKRQLDEALAKVVELQEAKAEARTARELAAAERQTRQGLDSELELTKKLLATSNRNLGELQSGRSNAEQVADRNAEEAEKTSRALAKQIDELKAQRAQDAAAMTALQTRLQEHKAEIGRLQEQARADGAKMSEVRGQVLQNQTAIAIKEQEKAAVVDKAEREKEVLRGQLLNLQSRVAALTAQQEDAKAEAKRYATRVAELEQAPPPAAAMDVSVAAAGAGGGGEPPRRPPRPTVDWARFTSGQPQPLPGNPDEPLDITLRDARNMRQTFLNGTVQLTRDLVLGDVQSTVRAIQTMENNGNEFGVQVWAEAANLLETAARGQEQDPATWTRQMDPAEAADIHRMCADRIWGDVITVYMGDKFLMTGPALANQVGWIRFQNGSVYPNLNKRLAECVVAWRWAHTLLRGSGTPSEPSSQGVKRILGHVVTRYNSAYINVAIVEQLDRVAGPGTDPRVERLFSASPADVQALWKKMYDKPEVMRHWHYNFNNPRDVLYPMASMIFESATPAVATRPPMFLNQPSSRAVVPRRKRGV